MACTLSSILKSPPLYAKSEAAFWNDTHISAQMLKAHLNPELEAASRKMDFIRRSADWISELVPPSSAQQLLDVGCGPGIYAEEFYRRHYSVTGVDFSSRSIDYAIKSARAQGLDITYIFADYLNMNLRQTFDFATMIYCDYGALSGDDRRTLLQRIHRHLKPGGKFLLDVFSVAQFHAFNEGRTWDACPNGGFWSSDEYIALSGCYKYGDHVTLEQIAIMTADELRVHHIWNTCFTKESLIMEIEEAGFKACGVYGDVAGGVYHKDNLTLALLAEKL